MPHTSQPTVLVTGCSEGGLGSALCRAFQKQGFSVIATVRDTSKALSLSQSGIDVISLDVTSDKSISLCADHVRNRTGGSLSVLVNNAGILLVGALLDMSLAESRKLYDVNVWGMLAVTQAFSPLLVEAKGVVLNICSIAGAVPFAWQGIYNSSKAAETFLSETLRIEMEPLGVRVITAMVGEVKTRIYENLGHTSLPEGSFYASVKQHIEKQAAGGFIQTLEPAETTARDLVSDILNGKSGQIWRGGSAGTARLASWLLPRRVLERLLHIGRGLDKVHSS